jgi:Protein of unknown function (DUF4127)
MKIALIPLDERPVNTRYPAMLAACVPGVQLRLPPVEMLSRHRRAADCPALESWLASLAPELDAIIVSIEMLGYGSLIASRVSSDGVDEVLGRLAVLRRIRRAQPQLQMLGFNVITRISNHDGNAEEPDYWVRHGRPLYALSQAIDRARHGQDVAAEIAALEATVPAQLRADFLRRRARNHAVNLAVMHLLADGVLDTLVLSSDDTSPYGLPTREKRWLSEWAECLALGDRVLMYPGADEVGAALLARVLNGARGFAPRVEVAYYPDAASEHVAAYEDGPVRITVERQVRAVGGMLVPDGGDIWLGVNAPLARREEFDPARAPRDGLERRGALAALVAEAARRTATRQRVVIADVAYPNGSDPALTAAMLGTQLDLTALAAYGAWNTAGNTIGVALAQACVHPPHSAIPVDPHAAERALLHRYVEDWGYQRIVRAEIRAQYPPGMEPALDDQPRVLREVETRLNAFIDALPGYAGRWRIVPGSARFPWQRTFEIDFELKKQ